MELIRVRRALLSVTDKGGLAEFARGLSGLGVELLSTGGTAEALRSAGLQVTDVASITGFPEMLDGRVKTLHPKIHGGILADRDVESHRADLERHGIAPIELVVVNLYAFEQTTGRPGATMEAAVHALDIGGPSMIRSAAKNHRHVAVVTSPARYAEVLHALRSHGGIPRPMALALAAEAFRRTADYDAAIARFFETAAGGEEAGGAGAPGSAEGGGAGAAAGELLPEKLTLELERVRTLRYGENPHQPAALYGPPGPREGVLAVRQHHGKEMSFTNYLDLNAALSIVAEFEEPVAVVIKHLNPCGVGFGATIDEAYARSFAADPLSAFGGVVGLNRRCDADLAGRLSETFLEIILAPSFSDEALEILGRKKNVRLMEGGGAPPPPGARDLRRLHGGVLIQEANRPGPPPEMRTVTRRAPEPAEASALVRAWKIVKHVKSNAIVLADASGTLGVGCGQTSRVDAVEDAIKKARRGLGFKPGMVLASDAFFPFRDSVDAAHAAGVTAIIQPGGSLRDAESIAAADEHAIAMVFTGERAFLH